MHNVLSRFNISARSGHTLLEVTMVTAIMGIAMLGFGSQTIYNTKANLSMQKDLIFSSMINEIQTASSNNVICTAALIGTTPAAGTGVAMNTPSNTFSAGSEYQIHWVKFSSRRCSGPRLYHSQTR